MRHAKRHLQSSSIFPILDRQPVTLIRSRGRRQHRHSSAAPRQKSPPDRRAEPLTPLPPQLQARPALPCSKAQARDHHHRPVCDCLAMHRAAPAPRSTAMPLPHLPLALARLALWLLHLLLANTLLSLLLPLSLFLSPTTTYNASSLIASTVWAHIQHLFTSANGARILVLGDALPPGESAIVVSNHVEWTDFYLVQALAQRAGMLGRCRWFAKRELRWVPFLGWGLWAMGMPLVSRRWAEDEREMERVFEGVVGEGWPMWLISFSESTRLTPSKRALAAAHARKTNKTLPPHLLLPRTKGFAASVQHLRAAPHVRAIYDLTLAYADTAQEPFAFQSPPTFAQSVLQGDIGRRWKMAVHVRRFVVEDLPGSEEGLRAWLEERWVEKGEVLEGLKRGLEGGGGWEGVDL
ncbi:hypothetical protein WHR41_07674 [Cladosporium halotolerans]|uniref:Phospholipid/glycerol acyltransferase domain-containing protein n=1 Tax=Cladosporium halotolerans TaxID=1052096 RepID=A0AB34KEQ5_9PEZI